MYLKGIAKGNEKRIGVTIKKMVRVKTYPLHKILDRHVKAGQTIDFISIDVEGLDYQVLCTNNWEKYQPKVILVESIGSSIEEALNSDIYRLLSSKGYIMISKTFHTNIYKRKNI